MGKETSLYILLGTYSRLASLVDVLVFLSCDFHVSNQTTPMSYLILAYWNFRINIFLHKCSHTADI